MAMESQGGAVYMLDESTVKVLATMVRLFKAGQFTLSDSGQGQFVGAQAPRVCAVKVLGPKAANGLYPGQFVYRAGPTSTTTTPTSTTTTTTTGTTSSTTTGANCRYINWQPGQDCWYADVDNINADTVHIALVVGLHDDLLPIALHAEDQKCSTNSSTTSNTGGCTGVCRYSSTAGSNIWTFVSSTCAPVTVCKCVPPRFCPPTEADCGTVYTETTCARGVVGGGACMSTSSTTTTTDGPGPCPTPGCQIQWNPVLGWQYLYDNCIQGLNCWCPYKLVGGPGLPDPMEGFNDCFELPPQPCVQIPPFCGGECHWVSLGEGTGWIRMGGPGCMFNGTLPGPCVCPYPTEEPGECGGTTVTGCAVEGCETCNGTTTSTSTTAGTNCNSSCYRIWNASTGLWDFVSTKCTSDCGCGYPANPGGNDCELKELPCLSPTTTTTTSSTTTPCGGTCVYNGVTGAIISYTCLTPCGCAPPPDPLPGGGIAIVGCTGNGTTTTTTTTSTTTTEGGWYCIVTAGSFVSDCASPFANFRCGKPPIFPGETLCSGPYANCAAADGCRDDNTTTTSTTTTCGGYYCKRKCFPPGGGAMICACLAQFITSPDCWIEVSGPHVDLSTCNNACTTTTSTTTTPTWWCWPGGTNGPQSGTPGPYCYYGANVPGALGPYANVTLCGVSCTDSVTTTIGEED